jgi:hypothetical protein
MLRIFKGKQAEYNKLILKSLHSGAETTTQIAEYIYFHRKRMVAPTLLNKLELRKIVSVISRKTGGLATLKKWHYINRQKGEKQKWELTEKGFPVGLTCFDTIGEFLALHVEEFSIMKEDMRKDLKQLPYLAETMNFFFDSASNEHVFGFLRDATLKLIQEGVDLDKLSVLDAKNLIGAQQVMLMAATEFAKTKRKAIEKTMAPSPNRKGKRKMKRRLKKLKKQVDNIHSEC